MKSLFKYILSLVLFFAGLELFVRANHQYFYALSDKLLLKIEMLENRQDDDVVFMGSSRTQDGFDAPAFEKILFQRSQIKIKAFNAATTGQNINRYLYNLEKLLQMKDIKHLVLETSVIGLKPGELGISVQGETQSELEEKVVPQSLEEQLQSFMVKNSYLVKVRKSFKPKIILRLFIIWTSDKFNHDIWFRAGTLKQLVTGFYKEYSEEQIDEYKPIIIDGTFEALNAEPLNANFERIAELLQNTDKKITFYNPPVKKTASQEDCNLGRHGMYKTMAQKLGVRFLDYSCGGFKKGFFKDDTHLNADGRIFFSQILARDLAPFLGGE